MRYKNLGMVAGLGPATIPHSIENRYIVIYFITVNYYSSALIAQMIASLPQPIDLADYALIIVNNSPDDSSLEQLQKAHIHVLEAGGNVGFGRGCNVGLAWVYERSPNAIVWLINPDACLQEETLTPVTRLIQAHPTISILGTLITTFSHNVWFSGGRFDPHSGAIAALQGAIDRQVSHLDCDWVSGCSLILNLQNFSECPHFDPEYFLYYEDFEFCWRYRLQGHRIAITHQIEVKHQPSSITNRNALIKTRHSTYSYLLTLGRFVSRPVFALRLGRLILYAIVLLPIRPSVGLGKWQGILDYVNPLRNHRASEEPRLDTVSQHLDGEDSP